MIPGLKIFHRGLILVGVPFILGLLMIFSLSGLLYQSDHEQIKEATYRKITSLNARLLVLTAQVPFFLAMSMRYDNAAFDALCQSKQDQIRYTQQQLIKFLKKTPDLADGAIEIQENVDYIINLTTNIAAAKKGSLPEFIGQISSMMGSINYERTSTIKNMTRLLHAGEVRTRDMEQKQALIRRQQSALLAAGIIANLIAAILLSLFFRRSIEQRLKIIRQNTLALSAGTALAKPLAGADEIAQLDQAFHAMDRDLKQAAARERDLFDHASDVICVLDSNNKFVKVNFASERNWGYSPDQLLSMTLAQILPAGTLNLLSAAIEQGQLTGEPFSFESKIVTAGGAEIDTSWSLFWSQLDRRLYCVAHDITERKRSEAMKKNFLSMISSDLKKPLSAMSAAAATLLSSQTGGLSKTAAEKLQMTGKNLHRLLGLVNDLLQVAEMESGSIEIKKEWCDTEEPLKRAAQEVEMLAAAQGIKLEVQACRLQWQIDPNRIIQVLVNLLSNAIKFSPQGKTVWLSAEQRGDMIEVRVRDEGRGIPATHREAIFEKFKQVEAADGKRKSGTGLGLPICKQIVENHGGTIGVESAEGQGSTFWFLIPRQENTALTGKAQDIITPAAAPLAPPSTSKAAAEKCCPADTTSSPTTALTPAESPQKLSFTTNLSLAKKGALLVIVPLIFELVLVGSLLFVLLQSDHQRAEELHYRQIAFETTRLTYTGFMMSIGATSTNGSDDWNTFRKYHETAKKILKILEVLLKDDKTGMEHLEAIKTQVNGVAAWTNNHEKMLQARGHSLRGYRAALSGRRQILPYAMESTRWLEKLCDDSERKESVSPERQKALRSQQAEILFLGLIINVAGSLALATFFAGNITTRLQILADNAMRLAKETPLNPPLSGSDEIAALDRNFHETALSLAEARKKERAVFDNSQDVICALSPDGRFTSVNPAAESLWGYNSKELAGRELKEIVISEDQKYVDELLEAGMNQHHEFELRICKKDKSIAYVLWSYSRPEEQGNIFCVVHDITSIKELARIRQEFLSMVSHDLRTPLTSVIGITKLILAKAFGPVEASPAQTLTSISKSGDQLLELINDLLDIEKLEAGKMQLVLDEANLGDIIERAVSATRDAGRVVLNMSDTDSKASLRLDRDRLVQAIANILNNADARTPAGSPVLLTVTRQESMLALAVKDCAPALSSKALKNLFDRFHAASTTGDTAAGEPSSTGLSMPIAKKIIESHGGTVTAVAEADGNLITVLIPMTAEPDKNK